MEQRGRKSAAALSVVSADIPGIARVRAPLDLTDAERKVWVAAVNSRPADWFGDEHIPLLTNYVRHVVAADLINEQLRQFSPKWLADDEGLRRYERLRKMLLAESNMVNCLARAMRLTHQSIYRANKAATIEGRAKKGRKPWETDEPEASET